MKENNNDIISKQMVLDEIDQMPTVIDADGVKYIEKTCLKIRINMLRPMNVIPVRYGHWIEDPDGWECQCSECRHFSSCRSCYCSACGARMDGKENGNETD